jgi:hypothetical protein
MSLTLHVNGKDESLSIECITKGMWAIGVDVGW